MFVIGSVLGLLHMLLAGFFGLHAKRSGRSKFWLLFLFGCPLLGSLAYYLLIHQRVVWLGRAATAAGIDATNPQRELLQARGAFESAPTVQNQMRLARTLLEAGQPIEAALRHEACLNISFASDLENRLGAARAWVQGREYERAVSHLQILRTKGPNYRPDQVSLLMAQALAGEGCCAEARMEFEFVISQFDSDDARAEYAIWSARWRDQADAARRTNELGYAA